MKVFNSSFPDRALCCLQLALGSLINQQLARRSRTIGAVEQYKSPVAGGPTAASAGKPISIEQLQVLTAQATGQ